MPILVVCCRVQQVGRLVGTGPLKERLEPNVSVTDTAKPLIDRLSESLNLLKIWIESECAP